MVSLNLHSVFAKFVNCEVWAEYYRILVFFFFPSLTVLLSSVNPNFLSYTKTLLGFTAPVQQV